MAADTSNENANVGTDMRQWAATQEYDSPPDIQTSADPIESKGKAGGGAAGAGRKRPQSNVLSADNFNG